MLRDKPVAMSVEEKQYQLKIAQEKELQRLISQFLVLDKNAQRQLSSSVPPALVRGDNIIKLYLKQHEDILKDLKRALGPERVRDDVKVFEKLHVALDETSSFDDKVNRHKIHLKEIENERKVVTKRVVQLRGQQVTDRQCQERIWHAMKIAEALENKLETQMIHFGTICTKNKQLRVEIGALMGERKIFLRQWDDLTRKLSEGKQIMLDLIEQATITYNQREEWCSKLQMLRTKAFQELSHNSVVMREFYRRRDNSNKVREFLEVKGQKRVMRTLQFKEEEKRRMMQRNLKEKLEIYKSKLRDIETFTDEKNVKKIALKFANQEHINLTNFNFVIETIKELEDMNDRLGFLHLDIDERCALHDARATQQETAIEQLETHLQEAAAETQELENDLNNTQRLLDDLLNGVSQLFQICKCASDPLVKLLGNNTKVTFYNVNLYLQIVEAKIHQILVNACYADDTRKKKVLSSDKEIAEIYSIDKIIQATPCSICMEHDTVSDVIDTLQVAWSRQVAQKKLANRLKLPEASNRVHNPSHCQLPKTRYIIQKRYE